MNDDVVSPAIAGGARLSWHQVWMSIAKVVGKRSLCTRDQVGAVIVDTSQRLVASGYNGPPREWRRGVATGLEQPCYEWCSRAREAVHASVSNLDPGYNDCPSLHAEANALLYSDASKRQGGTIYITSVPCLPCAKLIANSGLRAVHIPFNPDAADHRNPARSRDFLSDCGITVIEQEW